MADPFHTKLRDEIDSGQARRHEYCVKKLAFASGLLGFGALTGTVNGQDIDLSSLLWLVPVIAIAFDCYIVSEDFGVKRAGAYLALATSGATVPEREWESTFVHDHNNPFASYAFAIVSLVLWGGAAVILLRLGEQRTWLVAWSVAVLGAEAGLLAYSLGLRRSLKRSAPAEANKPANTRMMEPTRR